MAEAATHLWLHHKALIACRSLLQTDSLTIEPVADSTLRVVVERVHTGVGNGAVGLHRVPQLPDGCAAHLNRV